MNSSGDTPNERNLQTQHLMDALCQLAEVLNQRSTSYALIGGLGVAVRGNTRATEDVDFLIHVEQLRLPALLEAMRDCGCHLDVMTTIQTWNQDGMLALEWPGGIQVDLLKAVIPAFHSILKRASSESLNTQIVRVADAEGLLLLKLIAFRPIDQEDMRGLLLANSGQLDLDWVRSEFARTGLDMDRLDAFEELVRGFYSV